MKHIAKITTLAVAIGLLQIVPAHAAPTQTGDLTVSSAATTLYTRVNTAVTTTISVATANAVTGGATARTLTLANETKPDLAATQTENTTTSTDDSFTFTTAGTLGAGYVLTAGAASTKIAVSVTSASVYTLTPFASDEVAITGTPTTAKLVGTVSFKPATAGVYTYSITPTAGAVHTITVVVNDVDSLTVTSGLVKGATSTSATTASQSIGNNVTFIYTEDLSGASTAYVTTDKGGSITTATDNDGNLSSANGINYSDSGIWSIANSAVETATITLTSKTVGTQTVKVQVVDAATGLYSSLATLTVTWIAAASEAGIDAAQSTIYLVEDGDTCVFGSNKSGDVNAAAANAETVTAVPAGTVVDVCFIGRNAAGVKLSAASATVAISSAGATQGAESAVGDGYVSAQSAAAPSTYIGKATYTVIFVDALGGAATLSTTLTYWGDIASISIANPAIGGGYAAAYGGARNGGTLNDASALAALTTSSLPGTSTSGLGYVAVVAKDKGGNVINLARGTTNDIAGVTIDSTYTAGAPAAATSDSAGATLTLSLTDADMSAAAFGSNIYVVDCGSSAVAEKLSITVIGVNADGVKIPSNAVTFYCSDSTDKVTVTGTTSTVNVDVVDANGYPVADGTSVSLVASNGAVVAPATKTTVNGKFATAATFIPSSTSSTATVTAIVGSKSGTSAAIAGSGAASNQTIATQIDALNAKIVALNALIAKIMKKLGVK